MWFSWCCSSCLFFDFCFLGTGILAVFMKGKRGLWRIAEIVGNFFSGIFREVRPAGGPALCAISMAHETDAGQRV
jgi:hypothetical protein